MAISITITDTCPTITFTDTTVQAGYAGYSRNLVIQKPDGTYATLGTAVAQVKLLTLLTSSYAAGTTFPFIWCGTTVTFTVTTGRTDAACVAEDIAAFINAQTANYYSKTTAVVDGVTVTITSLEAGYPINDSVTPSAGSVTYTTTTANVTNFDNAVSSNNTLVYTPDEAGGLYTLKFYYFDASCQEEEFDGQFWNWCSDIEDLNCCLAKKLFNIEITKPCPTCKNNKELHQLRDLLDSINNFKSNLNYGQYVNSWVNSAKVLCTNCGC